MGDRYLNNLMTMQKCITNYVCLIYNSSYSRSRLVAVFVSSSLHIDSCTKLNKNQLFKKIRKKITNEQRNDIP